MTVNTGEQAGSNAESLYQALDTAGDSFRLLRLHPGNEVGAIQFDLFNAKLSDWKGKYATASYVWGSRDNPQSIQVNNHNFRVTKNLFDFLCAYRVHQKDRPDNIWIDAVCINQESVLERNHQVQIMVSIFSNCSCVYSWLGALEPHIEWLFDTWNERDVWRMNGRELDTVHQSGPGLDGLRKSLACLGSREYWKRVWILQEVLLPPSVILLCGHKSLAWNRFPKWGRLQRLERLDFFDTEYAGGLYEHPALFGSALSELVRLREGKSKSRSPRNFEDIYHMFRNQSCSIKHDSFFALLGLTTASSSDKNGFMVNYAMSYTELILEALRTFRFDKPFRFIQDAIDSLDIRPSDLKRPFQEDQIVLTYTRPTQSEGYVEVMDWRPSNQRLPSPVADGGFYACDIKGISWGYTLCLYLESHGPPQIGDQLMDLSSAASTCGRFVLRKDRAHDNGQAWHQIVGIDFGLSQFAKFGSTKGSETPVSYAVAGAELLRVSKTCFFATQALNSMKIGIQTDPNLVMRFACLSAIATIPDCEDYFDRNQDALLRIFNTEAEAPRKEEEEGEAGK